MSVYWIITLVLHMEEGEETIKVKNLGKSR